VKVLHVLAPAYYGGLEQVVLSLAVGQKGLGYDVQVMTLIESGRPEPAIGAALRAAAIPVISVSYPARSFRAQRIVLRRECARNRPDVLHTHGYLPDVLSASLSAQRGLARVSTVHGFTGGDMRNRIYEWMQRMAYFRFDAVVAVSQKLARELPSPRTHTVPNAWTLHHPSLSRNEARAGLGLSAEDIVVGWVGRISREKGLDILIEALPHVADLGLTIAVIGDGKERPALEARARELGAKVLWCGRVADAGRFFPAFDAFVLSSRTEGTPIVLFEAMHARIPVVAAAVGGVPDVVSRDEALLVPRGDARKLAGALREVFDNPGETASRATRAYKRLEKQFGPDKWLESYDAIYRKVIAERKGR